MYKVLIVEPQEFSLAALLNLPVWNKKELCGGFECCCCVGNGEEALAMIERNNYDLVLTEINLPLCDGLQLLKKVHVANKPPLIVFISDIVTFSYAREGFIYGAFDYLSKPVSAHDMEKLFERAGTELKRIKRSGKIDANISDLSLTPGQLNVLIKDFENHNPKVITAFGNLISSYYDSMDLASKQPYLLISKLYMSIVDVIYEKNPWISLYLPRTFHEQIDYFDFNNSYDYISLYKRKFSFLFELFGKLKTNLSDDTLANIRDYLLSNPDEDMRLGTIASKFYLNHTYLSNLFSTNSPVRYSQLVALIKMHRADCLINYHQQSAEDVAVLMGYKDFRHFVKLFKSVMGKHPSSNNRLDIAAGDYTI